MAIALDYVRFHGWKATFATSNMVQPGVERERDAGAKNIAFMVKYQGAGVHYVGHYPVCPLHSTGQGLCCRWYCQCDVCSGVTRLVPLLNPQHSASHSLITHMEFMLVAQNS